MSWLRFLNFDLGQPTPDAHTLRVFRERLTQAGAIKALFSDFEQQLRHAGYLPMSGQLMDATLVSAPRQRNTQEEKIRIKAGARAQELWPDKPAKAAQKDVDARWTVKQGKATRQRNDGVQPIRIAIPIFGYKSHIGADRAFGFIRTFKVTHAAAYDGAQLSGLIDPDNTASDVWADTAYRSAKNEAMLKERGKRSRIHRKKPNGRAMSERTRKANMKKAKVRARVEHIFAQQKSRMGLFIRTIGLKRAEAKIGLANIAFNIGRLIFHEQRLQQENCA